MIKLYINTIIQEKKKQQSIKNFNQINGVPTVNAIRGNYLISQSNKTILRVYKVLRIQKPNHLSTFTRKIPVEYAIRLTKARAYIGGVHLLPKLTPFWMIFRRRP